MERIPGALRLPLGQFNPASLPLDGSRGVICHCSTGRGSRQAAQRRIEAGAEEAAHLVGGLRAWKKARTRLAGGMHHVPL